jgi:hypothetical protein
LKQHYGVLRVFDDMVGRRAHARKIGFQSMSVKKLFVGTRVNPQFDEMLAFEPRWGSIDLCPDWSIILKVAGYRPTKTREKSLRSRPNEIKVSPKSCRPFLLFRASIAGCRSTRTIRS